MSRQIPHLSGDAVEDLRTILAAQVSGNACSVVLDAINHHFRDFQRQRRAFRHSDDTRPADAKWLRELDKTAERLEDLLSRRVTRAGREIAVRLEPRTFPVDLQVLSVLKALKALRTAITAAAPSTRPARGKPGEPALVYLDCAIADVLERAGIPLRQGEQGTLAQVLDTVHEDAGLPKRESRARDSARRAIKALPAWRELPARARAGIEYKQLPNAD